VPAWVLRLAERSDQIIHAGDVTAVAVLEELAACAPVVVALGNIDREEVGAWGAEPVVTMTVGEVAVTALHDAGPGQGREARLRTRFPGAGVIVFGHSHQPEILRAGDAWLVNPGSPTWKRRQPAGTVVTATVNGSDFTAQLVSGD
jgi:putative phosphoesterase